MDKLKEQFEKQRVRIGDQLRKQAQTAEYANTEWVRAVEEGVCDLDYVKRKNFIPTGLKKWSDILYVPLFDIHHHLHNIERIYPNGQKRPMLGGRVNDLFYTFTEINPEGIILLSEGISTAAIVWEATHLPTLCCRNAGNLVTVAHVLRKTYPDIKLHICGDNDAFKLEKKRREAVAKGRCLPTTNVGKDAAIKIDKELGAHIVFPDFSSFGSDEHFIKVDEPPSDFNDIFNMLIKKGFSRSDALGKVRRQLLR